MQFLSAEPQLFVADMARSLAFYCEKLGFELELSYGDPLFYAQVARGGAALNLRLVAGPVFDASFRAREADPLAATITLDEVDALFAAYRAADVHFHQQLRSERWGARTFIVGDPDGNLILFAGRC